MVRKLGAVLSNLPDDSQQKLNSDYSSRQPSPPLRLQLCPVSVKQYIHNETSYARQVRISLEVLSVIYSSSSFVLWKIILLFCNSILCSPYTFHCGKVMIALPPHCRPAAPKQPPAWYAHICPFHAFQLCTGTPAVCAGGPPLVCQVSRADLRTFLGND